jgi:hypothetical protein
MAIGTLSFVQIMDNKYSGRQVYGDVGGVVQRAGL